MKPLKTEYGGAAFRSRLEARWAVAFDALNVRWEYEPEQFQLAHGAVYTPDFFLPGLGLYLEVKPREVSFKWEWPKLADFADKVAEVARHERRDLWFYVLAGRPHAYGTFPNYVFKYDVMEPGRYQKAVLMRPTRRAWAVCPLCGVADISELSLATAESVRHNVSVDFLRCRWCAMRRPANPPATPTAEMVAGNIVAVSTLGTCAVGSPLKEAYARAERHKF